ncbi:MAG: hypothetical protein NT004_05875 [Bacteroidetes bacterium]|nr:hypothetical protein [Bacteroidota bacterium]
METEKNYLLEGSGYRELLVELKKMANQKLLTLNLEPTLKRKQ